MAWDEAEFLKMQKKASNPTGSLAPTSISRGGGGKPNDGGFNNASMSKNPLGDDINKSPHYKQPELFGRTPGPGSPSWPMPPMGSTKPEDIRVGIDFPANKPTPQQNGSDIIHGIEPWFGGGSQKPTTQPPVDPGSFLTNPIPKLPTNSPSGWENAFGGVQEWLSTVTPAGLQQMMELQNQLIWDSSQMNKNALSNMEGDMNRISALNNSYGNALPQARQEMMSGLKNASNIFDQARGQAEAQMNAARGEYDKRNAQAVQTIQGEAQKRLSDIDNFRIADGQDQALRKMQGNSQSAMEQAVQRNMGAAGRNWIESMGSKGMLDSSIATQGINDMQAQANRDLLTGTNQLESSFLGERLNLPYKNMEYAMQPAYQTASMQDRGGQTLASLGMGQASATLGAGKNMADLETNRANSAFGSSISTYQNLLNGLMSQAGLNPQYQAMANALPTWANKGYQGYMDSLMNMWGYHNQRGIARDNAEAQKAVAQMQAQAQREIAQTQAALEAQRIAAQKEIAQAQLQAQEDANETSPWDILF